MGGSAAPRGCALRACLDLWLRPEQASVHGSQQFDLLRGQALDAGIGGMRGSRDAKSFERASQGFRINVEQVITVEQRNQSHERLLLSLSKDARNGTLSQGVPQEENSLQGPFPGKKRGMGESVNSRSGQLESATFGMVIARPALMDSTPPRPGQDPAYRRGSGPDEPGQ